MGQGKSRRPKGTGSIYERGGVVIGQYEIVTPEGRIKRKYIRGKDKKEVAAKLAKAIAERDSGLSPRTVQIIHRTLHKALKQAVRWSLIPRNVTESVDAPSPHTAEIRPLSVRQVKALLEAAKGDRLEALYVLAITRGRFLSDALRPPQALRPPS